MMLSTLNFKYFSPVAMHMGRVLPGGLKENISIWTVMRLEKTIINRTIVKCR